MPAEFTVIDDQDPSVTYTGTWVVGGTSHEHAGTVSSSVKVGNHFSVPFTGKAIAVYGTFDSSSAGVKTSYAIDGGSATTVTSTSSGADSYQQLFWQSDAVPSGDHALVVTMLSVNNVGDGEGTVWFDYFNVTSESDATSSSTISAPNSGTHNSKSSSATAASSSSSGSSTPVAAPKKSSHSALIGGIIAAVLILIGIAAVFLFRRMRRKQRLSNYFGTAPSMSSSNGPPPTQPFLSYPTTPMTPMSGLSGSAPLLAAVSGKTAPPSPYGPAGGAPPPGPGFDPRLTYAASAGGTYGQPGQAYPQQTYPQQGPLGQAAYDPYAAIGAAMQQHPPQSSYAPSESSVPSSQYRNRGALSAVGGSSTADQSEFSDSVADLKRRQQQIVNSYEQGVSGSQPPPIQHVDSGVRELNPAAGTAPAELPPVYTPH